METISRGEVNRRIKHYQNQKQELRRKHEQDLAIIRYLRGEVTRLTKELESFRAKELQDKKAIENKHSNRTVQLAIEATSLEFYVPENVFKKTRIREFVEPRQIIRYLLADHSPLTLTQISALTGKVDHSSTLHSRNWVRDQIYISAKFDKKMETVIKHFKENL